MRIPYKSLFGVLFILLFAFSISTVRDGKENASLEALQSNLTKLRTVDTLFNESFEYKNPYDVNFTLDDFIGNTIHVIIYPLIKELHTCFGYGTTLFWKYGTTNNYIFLIKIILSFMAIIMFSYLIKPWAIIYLLISEYLESKKKKNNPWITIPLSIMITILLCALIIIIINIIF